MYQQNMRKCTKVIYELVSALASPDIQRRYAEALDQELPHIVEPGLKQFNRQQRQRVDELAMYGYDAQLQQAPQQLDELLTDCFAIATWNRWPLPVKHLGQEPCQMTEQVQGLLGNQVSPQGASVFCFDNQRIALVRQRVAGLDIDHPCQPSE